MQSGKDIAEKIWIEENRKRIYKKICAVWDGTSWYKLFSHNPFCLNLNEQFKLYKTYAVFKPEVITERLYKKYVDHNMEICVHYQVIEDLYLLQFGNFDSSKKEELWLFISKIGNEFVISNTDPRIDETTKRFYGDNKIGRPVTPEDFISHYNFYNSEFGGIVNVPQYYMKKNNLKAYSSCYNYKFEDDDEIIPCVYIGFDKKEDDYILL